MADFTTVDHILKPLRCIRYSLSLTTSRPLPKLKDKGRESVPEPARDHQAAECKQNGKLYGSVPEATVKELFNCYGGVARYVLQHPSLKPNAELPLLREPILSAIHRCNVVQVQQAIGAIDSGPEASHQLLHIIADDNFNKQCILFASRWAANEFAKRAWVNERQQLLTLLASCDGSIRGTVYEAMMHSVLAMGGTFDVVQLDPTTLARGEKKKLDIQPCEEFRFCEDVSDMAAAGNIYLIPKSRKFPAIDAIKMPEMYLFQMTVATPKHISAKNLEAAFDLLNVPAPHPGRPNPSLYYVVHPDVFEKFKLRPEKAEWPPRQGQVRSAGTQLYILCGTYPSHGG